MSKKSNKKGSQDTITKVLLLTALIQMLIKLIELIEKLIEQKSTGSKSPYLKDKLFKAHCQDKQQEVSRMFNIVLNVADIALSIVMIACIIKLRKDI